MSVKDLINECRLNSKSPLDVHDTSLEALLAGWTPRRLYEEGADVELNTSVYATGVNPGDVVSGMRTQAKGAKIAIEGSVPPYKPALDTMRSSKDVWNRFLLHMATLPYFQGRTLKEIEFHLFVMESDEEIYMDDTDVLAKVLDTGVGDLNEYVTEGNDVIERALTEFIPLKEISKAIPIRPGQKGGILGRTNLLFRRSLWSVERFVLTFLQPSSLELIVDVTSSFEIRKPTSGDVVVNTKKGVGVVCNYRRNIHTLDECLDIAGIARENFDDFYKISTCIFTPAGLKSLLQKLIRFRAKYFEMPNRISSSSAAVMTFICLYVNRGSFVPDLQKFVSGSESAFKRLVVTVYEDAWTDNVKVLSKLMTWALILQNTGFYPDDHTLRQAFDMCKEAVRTPKAWLWNCRDTSALGLGLSTSLNHHAYNAVILKTIGSFLTDVEMIYSIAGGVPSIVNKKRPKSQLVTHCFDQHWCTDLVYHLYQYTNFPIDEGLRPFQSVNWLIFRCVSGINPRRVGQYEDETRHWNKEWSERSFVQHVQSAQLRSFQFRYISLDTFDADATDATKHTTSYTMSMSQIAGYVGTIRVTPTILATLNTTDISENPYVFKEPSRSKKSTEVSGKSLLNAYTQLRVKLAGGIRMANGALLKTEDDLRYGSTEAACFRRTKFFINGKPLGEYRSQKVTTYVMEKPRLYKGVITHARDYKAKLCEIVDVELAGLLRSCGNFIEFPGISRTGGGTKEFVGLKDLRMYYRFTKLCEIVPGLFVPHSALKWKLTSIPFLQNVVLRCCSHPSGAGGQFDLPLVRDARMLHQHQSSALEEMIEKYKAGNHTQFLYATVGMGKTYIVLEYLRHILREVSTKHIIYTLPASAMSNVIEEIRMNGFDYTVSIPLKTVPKKYASLSGVRAGFHPQPHTITLIEHDHLRRLDISHPAFRDCVFVVDEVHKGMNDTIRSKTIKNISQLAQHTIVFTGTPMIDSKTYKLMWYLQRVVDFPVNERNMWVAANQLTARIKTTGIKIVDTDIVPDFGKRLEEYRRYAPVGVGGKNESPSQGDVKAAMDVCYEIILVEMARYIKRLLATEPGVFVVVYNARHAALLEKHLVGIETVILSGGVSVTLTGETSTKVVITTPRYSTGYTLTAFRHMLTSIYPSNNADREQLRGRINRIGQKSDTVYYTTFHMGILSYIRDKYLYTTSMTSILKGLAEKV